MDINSFFYNERYSILEYLFGLEEPYEDSSVIKCSQDNLVEQFNMSKGTVNVIINELIEKKLLMQLDHSGKYRITDLGHEVLKVLDKDRDTKKAKQYNCISLFAGVGGIELGFEQAGFKTIYANEFDEKAIHTYKQNFSVEPDGRDVRVVAEDVQKGIDLFNGKKVDIILGGFPCQAFSVAGYRQGFNDDKGRGDLFFEIIKIAEVTKPEVIFLENVKNLKGHDGGRTFKIIKQTLEEIGYYVHAEVLNTMEYGNIPQNRERIYIVAFKDKEKFDKFHYPSKVKLTNTLHNIIDFEHKLDNKLYYTPEKFSHYEELSQAMTSKDTVYQWRRVYVRENKSGVCPTLTANMGTGGHNVPLVLTDTGIRKLTPRECFALQGFPADYTLPDDVANSALYKQAGNSVSVSVIRRIAEQILKVL